ncbi:MAG: hypothetical protein ACTS73_08940 [Arsenophonus sp. NEOnobi-MAG3]
MRPPPGDILNVDLSMGVHAVVRNGYLLQQTIQTAMGDVEIKVQDHGDPRQ